MSALLRTTLLAPLSPNFERVLARLSLKVIGVGPLLAKWTEVPRCRFAFAILSSCIAVAYPFVPLFLATPVKVSLMPDGASRALPEKLNAFVVLARQVLTFLTCLVVLFPGLTMTASLCIRRATVVAKVRIWLPLTAIRRMSARSYLGVPRTNVFVLP